MNKLLKSGLVLTIGNLLIQGLSFITLPIYTRIIPKEVLGEFNLYTSWISIIFIFIGLQLSGSLSIGKIKYKNYDEYCVNILTLSNIFFLFLFFVIYILKSYLVLIFNFGENYILIMFLMAYFSYGTGFLGGYFIQLQEAVKSFVISFLGAISNVVLSLSLVYMMKDDFKALLLGRLIPTSILFFIVMIYFYRKKNISYKKEYLTFALGISLPLIFHNLGHNILNQFDRIMVGKMLGLKEVALYSFGYNVATVIQLVFSSLNSVWCPYFFKLKKDNSKDLRFYIKRYISVALFCTLGYLTIFPELALILGGKEYIETVKFISFIIISFFFVFLYSFPVNIQFYNENTKFIPFGTLFSGFLNIGLNYILIPKFNIYGAVIATVISYFVLLVVHHFLSKKMYNYNEVSPLEYLKLIFIVLSYALTMNYFVDSLLMRWSFGILVLLIYIVYFKKDLLKILEWYKEKR